jgi:hypothetical protein
MADRLRIPQTDHGSLAAFIGKIVAKFSSASISKCGFAHLLSCGPHTKNARVWGAVRAASTGHYLIPALEFSERAAVWFI